MSGTLHITKLAESAQDALAAVLAEFAQHDAEPKEIKLYAPYYGCRQWSASGHGALSS